MSRLSRFPDTWVHYITYAKRNNAFRKSNATSAVAGMSRLSRFPDTRVHYITYAKRNKASSLTPRSLKGSNMIAQGNALVITHISRVDESVRKLPSHRSRPVFLAPEAGRLLIATRREPVDCRIL